MIRMNSRPCVFSACCLLLLGNSLAASLVATPDDCDFGLIKSGEIKERSIEIKNTSRHPIDIAGLNKSCTCTYAEIDKSSLKPGEKGILKIKIQGSPQPAPMGAIVDVLWKEKGSDQKQSCRVNIRALVETVALLDVPLLSFESPVEISSEAALHVRKGTSNAQWNSIAIESDLPSVKVKTSSESSGFLVQTSHKEDHIIGTQKGKLRISFYNDGKKLPQELIVPIVAKTSGNLTIAPPTIYFGIVRQGKSPTKTLLLSSRNLKIKDLQSSSPSVSVKVTNSTNDSVEISTSISSSAEKGSLQTFFDAHLEQPPGQIVRIPVVALIE